MEGQKKSATKYELKGGPQKSSQLATSLLMPQYKVAFGLAVGGMVSLSIIQLKRLRNVTNCPSWSFTGWASLNNSESYFLVKGEYDIDTCYGWIETSA